jgi:hypothetical protein
MAKIGLFAFLAALMLLQTSAFAAVQIPQEVEDILTFFIVDLFKYPADTKVDLGFFVFNLFLPLLAVIAVMVAFMKELNIFRRSPNLQIMLAVAIALMALFSGGLALLVLYTSMFLGGFAWLVFAGMFVVGIVFYAATTGWRWRAGYSEAKAFKEAYNTIDERLKQIEAEKYDLNEKLSTGRIDTKTYDAAYAKLLQEEADLYERLRALTARR